MPTKTIIATENAPSAIGTYSQAVKVDHTVYISGQIPLVPASMEMVRACTSIPVTVRWDGPCHWVRVNLSLMLFAAMKPISILKVCQSLVTE